MGRIPKDAKHWDSGDWIEWHRTPTGADDRICAAATSDPSARLAALHVNLLRAAKGYFEMTGQHLPVYRTIAHVFAALHYNVDLEGPERTCAASGLEVLCIRPNDPTGVVEVDLSAPFTALLVVRIDDNFTTQARVMDRDLLPDRTTGSYTLSWQAMPQNY
ncbi:MAG: hypothetical protein AB8B47_00040 [Roseobacter sp.]